MSVGTTGYNAATNGRRLVRFPGTTRGINSLILGDGPQMRARARKAAIDNPWVVSAIRGFRADVIGDGIKPHFQHPKRKIREGLKKSWDRWTTEADSSFDPVSRKGIRDFYGQQSHVTGEMMEAGEAFARFRPRFKTDGFTVPFQIQLIDPEQVPFWKQDGGQGNNIVRGGVEFDALGRRVAYHMYRQHPGDSAIWPNSLDIIRVPGETVAHVFDPMRGNPIRGVTWLASILVKLEDLGNYDDAVVLKQKLSTFFIGWTKRQNAEDPLFRENNPDNGGAQTSAPPDGVAFSEAEPGTILDLDDNDTLEFNSPPDVGTQYETFMRVQLRAISRVLVRAYHQLTGDVSQTSYSSIRADLVNVRRELEHIQFNIIAFQFCNPVVKYWLDQAAFAGVIDANDYAKNPGDYLDVEWRTARWAWVDPLKDIEAEKMLNRSGYKARSASIIEMGYDPEVVDEQFKSDQERADGLGLVFDTDGRRPDGKGATDVSPDAEAAAEQPAVAVATAGGKK